MNYKHRVVILLIFLAFQSGCGDEAQISAVDVGEKVQLQSEVQNEIGRKDDEVDYFAHLRRRHKEILKAWIAENENFRPAVEDLDGALDKQELARLHKKGNTQFYSAADINKDGKEDFAVVLVNVSRKNNFAVAIFNGGSKKVFLNENLNGMGVALIEYMNKRDDYFSSDSYLHVDLKESGCVAYIPEKDTYKLVACM